MYMVRSKYQADQSQRGGKSKRKKSQKQRGKKPFYHLFNPPPPTL